MWKEQKLKVDSCFALSDLVFEYDWIQTCTKNRGSSVSTCKVMCQEVHPTLKHTHTFTGKWGGERVHRGAPYKEQTTSSFCWHTTWTWYHTNVHLLLSCSSLLSLSFCFLLLYGAAPSSSYPQEVIHFLIICTSNRGRHGDADHKFSPPPLCCGAIAQQQLPLIGAVGSNC